MRAGKRPVGLLEECDEVLGVCLHRFPPQSAPLRIDTERAGFAPVSLHAEPIRRGAPYLGSSVILIH